MRRLIPVFAIAALVTATLAACAPAAAGIADCTPFPAGAASKIVTAEGKVGSEPTVDFPTPLISKGSQVSELVRGTGARLENGAFADIAVTISLGTGEQLQQAGYDAAILRSVGETSNSINEALECATIGSRLALTTSAKAALGAGALDSFNDPTKNDKTTMVFVIDVKGSYLGKANGVNQLQTSGLPSVVTAVDGQPGVVLPGSAPPKKAETVEVKSGGGDKVAKGDGVVVHYSQFTWTGDTVSEGDSTWTSDPRSPKAFEAGPVADGDTTTPPFAPNLVGKKVGSQILHLEPTDDGATFWVVDILGILPSAE